MGILTLPDQVRLGAIRHPKNLHDDQPDKHFDDHLELILQQTERECSLSSRSISQFNRKMLRNGCLFA